MLTKLVKTLYKAANLKSLSTNYSRFKSILERYRRICGDVVDRE